MNILNPAMRSLLSTFNRTISSLLFYKVMLLTKARGVPSQATLLGKLSSARGVKALRPRAVAREHMAPDSALQHEFNEKGYLLVPGFASKDECQQLMKRMRELVDSFDPSSSPCVFSTKEEQKQASDRYFFESANNTSFFFEEAAVGPGGKLLKPKELAINKAGHATHDLDPVFRAFSRSEKVSNLLKALGYKRPIPVQSMYIFKNPGIGGEVVPHQDSTFLWTSPEPSVVGLWLALEDATVENGCLFAEPGSHKGGVHRRFVRGGAGAAAGGGMAAAGGMTFDKAAPAYDLSKLEPLEVAAGTLVVLHGAVLHMSHENKSDKSRHAYSVHVVEGAEGVAWDERNWLQRKEGLPFEPLYSL